MPRCAFKRKKRWLDWYSVVQKCFFSRISIIRTSWKKCGLHVTVKTSGISMLVWNLLSTQFTRIKSLDSRVNMLITPSHQCSSNFFFHSTFAIVFVCDPNYIFCLWFEVFLWEFFTRLLVRMMYKNGHTLAFDGHHRKVTNVQVIFYAWILEVHLVINYEVYRKMT